MYSSDVFIVKYCDRRTLRNFT